MEILRNIGNFFSEIYQSAVDYINGTEASPAAQTAAQPDRYRTIELREVQMQELIERSQPVRTGCYIQMHQVPNHHRLQEALRRQLPPTTPPAAPAPRP